MTEECGIVHENGDYWILHEPDGYLVMKNEPTYILIDSSYPNSLDGLRAAIYRCDYLSERNK